jgi:chromosome partitioning protein
MAFGKEPERGLADLLTTGQVDITALRPNLYFIDSGRRRLVETELFLARQPDREKRLNQVLSRLRGSDYVICDCPPATGLINMNVLNYVDSVVVPVSMDFFACEGAKKTLTLLQEIYEKIGHNVELKGILATFYDVRTKISKRIYSELLDEFGERVFATKIRINTQLKEAQANKKTIFEHSPYSNGALDYFLFTKEITGVTAPAKPLAAEGAETWKA